MFWIITTVRVAGGTQVTDDIVTRLRQWHTGTDLTYLMFAEAADEIERLRRELQHSALQTNVMRNIATAPYGDTAEQIADLAAELAECQRQYIALKADRDRWAKWGEHVFVCPNKGINACRDCVSPATADAMTRVDRGGRWYE